MEYVISGDKKGKFVCVKSDGSLYVCNAFRKAYRTSNLIDIASIFDKLRDEPYLYFRDTWTLETWEEVSNRRTRIVMRNQALQLAAKIEQKEKDNSCCDTPNKRKKCGKKTRQKVYLKSNKRCAICGRPLQMDFPELEDYVTIDHIVPLNKGGENVLENYQATCKCCNQIKADILPEVFANDFASALAQEIIENSYQRKIFLTKILRTMCKQSLLAVKATLL